MSIVYQVSRDGHYQVIPGGKEWNVFIPAYVYDLWMPLLGAEAIGVYGAYVRLGFQNDAVYGRTLNEWAQVFRIGTRTLAAINAALEECGFIRIEHPSVTQKQKGFTTKIIVLNPPREVLPELIRKYAINGDPERYQLLTPWFLEENGGTQSETGGKANFQVKIDSDGANFQVKINSRESQFSGENTNQESISNS